MNPLKKYVSNLKREDIYIWKPTKKQKKPQNNITPNTQIFNTSGTMAKSNKKKSE